MVDMEINGLALEYFGLAFMAALGVIQAAAVYNGLRGISFFNCRLRGYIFSAVIISAAMVAFFTWNQTNATGIIEGSEQAGLFALAAPAAYIFTLIFSPIFNGRRLQSNTTTKIGLEALKENNIFQIIRRGLGGKR